MLREWHSAARIGFELEELFINGEKLDDNKLALLNIWISVGGAWRASRSSYFLAWEQLERVIRSAPEARLVRRRLRRVARAKL
jgi:hypothetical protein